MNNWIKLYNLLQLPYVYFNIILINRGYFIVIIASFVMMYSSQNRRNTFGNLST